MRVVVVGGGIGGLALAAALRRVGIDVVVLERAERLEPLGAGLGLAANALRALEAIGLADTVVRGGRLADHVLIRRRDGRMLADLPAASRGERLLGIHRARLQEALIAGAGAETVRLGASCVGLREETEGVVALLADGREEPGDVLVGADGIHSVVREILFLDGPPRYAGYAGWRMVAPVLAGLDESRFTESWGRGLRVGIIPIGHGEVYWFVSETAGEGEARGGPGSKDRLAGLLRDWHDPIPALAEGTPAEAISVTDIHDRPPRREWGRGRVTLLGDAAHPMTPNIGQGAGQTLEDAAVLAHALAGEPDPVAALRAYERRRVGRANAIVRLSRQAGALAQASSWAGCALRDGLMRAMPVGVQLRRRDRILAFEPPPLAPTIER